MPSSRNLKKVADYFGVTTDYLLGRDGIRLSEDSQIIAAEFDSLPESKQNLVKQYLELMKTERIEKTCLSE
jgi:ATP-dependent protease HslVU (ClpYQ) ATPase subunit